jgi:hypothetical protein
LAFNHFIKITVKNDDLRVLLDTKQNVVKSKIIDTLTATEGCSTPKLSEYSNPFFRHPSLLYFGDGIQKVQPLIYDKMQKAKADNN